MKLIIATHNRGKAAEFARLLRGIFDEAATLDEAGIMDDVEESGTTFSENAILKAEAACRASRLPALADDSGLCVDALGGAPGVYSARYAGCHGDDEANRVLLLKKMENVPEGQRQAHFACALALARPGRKTLVVEGQVHGTIGYAQRGENGFGYDNLFIYRGGRTLAEMSPSEKNAISHRAAAVERLRQALEEEEHAGTADLR
nr:XTP/dITP diphosphatase [bacterium]